MNDNQINFLDIDVKEAALGFGDDEWAPPSSFPDLTNCERIAIDLETRDPNLTTLGPGWCRDDGYVIGYAVAAGDFVGYYPVRHEDGNLPEKSVVNWLKKQMATPNIEKVMHNAMYDLGWMRWAGIEVQGPIIDTMIAAPMLNENRRYYNLNSLTGEYLGEYKNEKMLKGCGCDVSCRSQKRDVEIAVKVCGQLRRTGCCGDSTSLGQAAPEIIKDEVSSIFELESSLLPCLLDMKTKGVRVDIDKAELVKKDLKKREDILLKEIKEETGVAVSPWEAASIAQSVRLSWISYTKDRRIECSLLYKTISCEPHAPNCTENCEIA